MRMRITNCPKTEKCFAVSATVRPVTQTADVDVNSASTKRMGLSVDAFGSISSNVPMAIRRANPIIVARAGDLKNVLNTCLLDMLFI